MGNFCEFSQPTGSGGSVPETVCGSYQLSIRCEGFGSARLNTLHLPPQQGARTLPDNRRCILSAPRFFQLTRKFSGCGGVQITHRESGNIKVLSYQDLDHDSQLYYPDNFLQLHGVCICRTRAGRQCAMWRREGKSCSHPGSLPERRRYRAGSSLDRFFRNQPQGFIAIRQESPRSRMGAG